MHTLDLGKVHGLLLAIVSKNYYAEWRFLAFPVATCRATLAVLTRAMFGGELAAHHYTRLEEALLQIVEQSPGDESSRLLRSSTQLQPTLAVFDAVYEAAQALGREQNSLLAMLLDAVDAATGHPLTAAQLREEILFVFAVGFENIATGLTKALRLLIRHPDKLATLQAEVNATLGNELPSVESIAKLDYAGMALQEALRLHAPAPWLMRTAAADDEINGHSIPAGVTVILPTRFYHYDPLFWPNPEVFEPERFHPTRATERHPSAWLPFGAGQRFCLGRDFAMMEGKLILAMTVQRFDFAVDGSGMDGK